MYGRKASELVKEFASSDPGQLSTFNNDLFAQVLEECSGHLLHLQPLMSLSCQETDWIIDSGASYHITPHRDMFTSYTSGNGRVRMANHGVKEVIGMGNIKLETDTGCRLILRDSERRESSEEVPDNLDPVPSRTTRDQRRDVQDEQNDTTEDEPVDDQVPPMQTNDPVPPPEATVRRKIQEHENQLKDKRRPYDETSISEDESRKLESEKIDIQSAMKSDQFGALVHHLSLVRNKRCLMAYVYNRAEVIRNLGWMVDSVLPEEIEEKLNSTEKEYFKNHAATLQSYMAEVDLHLTVDTVPPKDPYIKVRVLDEIGEVVLSDQVANLARHAIMFLRRTDAEPYITQGQMEELTG
ncbi:hypothetical protein BUALT_Bualt02G0110000 [Buddleja alternifolia]|uniref:GINS subunit domain-containing protein n=1 Tax=Buddleja alternifolia TaxID=168488 RepID=A0AAV6Y1E6_9LAMI|nr:hypothetical protein BUALT_Bualt02G0110000 [Buddleja alternifolia]